MKYKIRTQLSAGFALIVLITIALVSLASNLLINQQFEKYVSERQTAFADGLAQSIGSQYDVTDKGWNLDYIHGFGMYALEDGYIIKLYDAGGTTVWDAENHDMQLCNQIMADISIQLARQRLNGSLVTQRYELTQSGELVGFAEISYYSPYYSSENEFRFITSLNYILLAVGVFSLIGAVTAGVLWSKRLAMPITKVTEITSEISEGNYNIRFEPKSGTVELMELAHSVNQMADSLGQQETIRKRLTTDVAHELRTPVANVSAQLEMIIEGVLEAEPERLNACYNELNRISGLINDLEDLSQIENENLKLKRESVDLLELAKSTQAAFETAIKEKHIDCEIIGTPCVILGDKMRLHQVIYNLLSNAVKYSGKNGKIKIETGINDTKDWAILTVSDNGIGIDDKDLPLVFERFYRADKSRTRKTGGTGIGLAIAKAIVQAHGGKIRAESTLGAGSTFFVYLPILTDHK